MLPTLEGGIAALRRRRWLVGWSEAAGAHVQVALVVAGVAALLARLALRAESRAVAPLLALAALGAASAALVAWRRRPGKRAAAAWLDVYGGARGQVVTEGELGGSEWSDAARAQLGRALAALPRASPTRAARAAAPAALFAALAIWVPIPRAVAGPPPVVAGAAIAELREELAALEEALDLPEDVSAELAERLERVEAEAERGEPASTFEALDRLGERLDAEAERALEAARQAAADLDGAAGDPDLGAAQESLESALSGMERAGMAGELPKTLEAALATGTLALPEGVQLSSAELGALSRELRGVLDARVGKLAAGRLIDPSKLRELRELPAGAGGLGSLAEFDPSHVCDEDCKKPGGT